MSLYAQLQQARSEEDVKDAYIKVPGLKNFTRGLIDIRTQEIWFEAKDTGKNSSYEMFTQLWQAYFADTDVRTVRDELKLNRSDVGRYQIRNALKARNASGDAASVDFTPFEIAYKALSEKLQPQVFELGFLR